MNHCATEQCATPATTYITAHGSGPITYRAALTCHTHHKQNRAWVARAGPTVHETPLHPDQPQPQLAQTQLF